MQRPQHHADRLLPDRMRLSQAAALQNALDHVAGYFRVPRIIADEG
jgi:Asp-tRNA(Asn)/Glu-tRNA(Gln) amidotransferase C subunit